MYNNQPHDKHGFYMEYKMHENYRNKDEKLTLNTKNRRNKKNANKGNLQTRVKMSGEHNEDRLLNANKYT